MLWQAFLPLPLVLDYAFRYEEYKEQLCENKDNPESSCHGSCQISRILQGETESGDQPKLPGFNFPSDWLAQVLDIELLLACMAIDLRTEEFVSFPRGFTERMIKPPQIML